ncbi:hypothetical protein WJX79_007635 [Trebouxia sp. C0005]
MTVEQALTAGAFDLLWPAKTLSTNVCHGDASRRSPCLLWVPVLVDGDTVVHDSWSVVEYLEKTCGDKPSLFGDAKGKQKQKDLQPSQTWSSCYRHCKQQK